MVRASVHSRTSEIRKNCRPSRWLRSRQRTLHRSERYTVLCHMHACWY